MATRVLTLFDEEFFEESEPNKPASTKSVEEQPEVSAAETATPDDAEKALDQQMRSELLAMDYTAFIHKDLPFDPSEAAVVQKDKEIAVYIPPTIPDEQQSMEAEPEAETDLANVEVPPAHPAEEHQEVGREASNEDHEQKLVAPLDEEAEQSDEAEEAPVRALPNFELAEKYYSIGEVATMFGVNTSHIRFWTNEFNLKPRTTRKGGRLYLPTDIKQLRLIHHLVKEKKHTIKGAKEKLKQSKTQVENQLNLKTALQELKSQLLHIKLQLSHE